MKKIILLLTSLSFMYLSSMGQTIFYVSPNGDNSDGTSWGYAFNKLEDALAAAQEVYDTPGGGGGEIWVAAGTYTPPLNKSYRMVNNFKIYGGFIGSEVELSQRNWKLNKTILRGNGRSVIHNNFSKLKTLDNAVIDGFIITGGKGSICVEYPDNGYIGGGISNEYANSTIKNCIIENCEAYSGGGINNYNSSLRIDNVIIQNNKATLRDGGGICSTDSSGTHISNCIIVKNTAKAVGGGVFTLDCKLDIDKSKIMGNIASRGAGVYNGRSYVILSNLLISGNYASGSGGGVYNANSKETILINVTISGNAAFSNAGGLSNINSPLSTLSKVKVINSIIWGNKKFSTANTLDNNIYLQNNSSIANSVCDIEYTYSLVEGCIINNNWNAAFGTDGGNNINANPSFINYQGVINSTPITAGNFRLSSNSVAIDAGSLIYNHGTDLDNKSRVFNGIIDMGAYEFNSAPTIIYVDQANLGVLEDGMSWNTAYRTLTQALAEAGNYTNLVQEIWVASGTYLPLAGTHFTMLNNVGIYGGFIGDETNISQRDLSNMTVLLGNGGSVIRNQYTQASPLNNSAVLDGFVITGGKGEKHPVTNIQTSGGGICNMYASPIINNCVIIDCKADLGGGIDNSYSNPKIYNTRIENNIANSQGGGIHNSFNSNPELWDVTIRSNSAISHGGGISNSASMSLGNCEIRGNKANLGAGIYAWKRSYSKLINVLLAGNWANTDGGAIASYVSQMDLINVTIACNHSLGKTGGLYYYVDLFDQDFGYTTYVNINNSIIFDNSALSGNNDTKNILNRVGHNNIIYKYSLIQRSNGSGSNWNTSFGIDGGNNIDAQPWFVYPYLPNDGPIIYGDYSLRSYSVAINAGNNLLNNTTLDLVGNARKYEGIIDMGAYEFQDSLNATSKRYIVEYDKEDNLYLSDNDNTNITIYPNPVAAGSELRVELESSDKELNTAKIEIYNLMGVKIIDSTVSNGNNSITMPTIPGQYIVRITTNNGIVKTEKIIVE